MIKVSAWKQRVLYQHDQQKKSKVSTEICCILEAAIEAVVSSFTCPWVCMGLSIFVETAPTSQIP